MPKSKRLRDPDRLLPRQRKFVEFYVENGGNTLDAYRRAGYSEKSANWCGYDLVNRPYIQAAIAKRTAEVRAGSDFQRKKILQDLETLIEIAMGRDPDPITQQKRLDVTSAKSILELVGKAHAMWIDAVHVSVSDEQIIADFQRAMSKRINPDIVEEILLEVEQMVLSRKPV